MSSFTEKMDLTDFSLEKLDISEIEKYSHWLPENNVIDLNIAEQGLIVTLQAQNILQEKITQLDLWISLKESEKDKAWTKAALTKSIAAGLKTSKDREWYAQADDDYIHASNELGRAKAAKKWLENKCGLFSNWHYAFKTFLRRDYDLERNGNIQPVSFDSDTNIPESDVSMNPDDFGADGIEWK